jgi:anthranilate phosphoribosyltransferase
VKPELLRRLLDPTPLGPREVRATFDELLDPSATDLDRAARLVALEGRPRNPRELAAFALELLLRARPFPVPRSDRAIDLCGSGGAPRPSFNVSTLSAVVVAAAGVPVVKHGNRSARGPCGSSDLLAALGLPVMTSPEFARESYRRWRIAFLHAPLYHPATAIVAPARRMLGVPTIFNRLGPISNPARVRQHVTGARSFADAEMFASALAALGVDRGVAMASADGADEFSPRASTAIRKWGPRDSARATVRPERLLRPGERRGPWGALPPDAGARRTREVLAGAKGAIRGSVLLTSGAALWVAGRAASLAEGVEAARATLDGGAPAALLSDLEELGRRFGGPNA